METRVVDITKGKRVTDTTFDLIYKHYFGEVDIDLSEKEEEIRNRWRTAWDLLSSMKSKHSAVKVLVKDFGITERTAYNDIKNAERLFQDPFLGNKELHRAKVNRWIDKLVEKLWSKEDYETIDKLIGRYIKNNNTDVDSNSVGELIKKMKPIKIEFTADPEVLKKQAEKLMQDVAEDIDYTDISE